MLLRNRLLLIAWLVSMIALGFALGLGQDRLQEWHADRGLLARLGVRPAALPSGSVETSQEIAATGLRFEALPNSGIAFAYDNGPENQFHLAETLGGGVGAIDFDRDERPDLVFVDGGDPIRWPQNRTERLSLYRNQGDGRFSPVSPDCGLSWTGYGHGCAVADVNNDGFDDVLITGYQQSGLFLNQGDGTFQESTQLRQLTGERWCATACWSDLDRDGDLDLYIACYADCSRSLPTPVCESKGTRVHCNPHSYRPVPDFLFENTGEGGFVDRSESAGIAQFSEYGLGVIAADLDRDGWQEIFVANDGDRNLLFRRTADWVYEEIGLASGVAFNGQGETMGSMGVACADFDQNGRLDIFTTNFSNESNALFHQLDDFAFVDNTQGTTIDRTSRPLVGWSAIAFDADADRFVDLFVANGHVTQMPGEEWAQLSSLLKGARDGYQDARSAGPWWTSRWHARGACRTDLNRDGLDDLVVSLIDDPAAILLNTAPAPGHRIQLRLIGTVSSRTAAGAMIELQSGSGTALHYVSRNAGYLSSNDDIVTLGLGTDTVAETIRVLWPGGEREELRNVAAGSRVVMIERQRTVVEPGW
ncbi:MAG TPA: CRTAC1 family protein [Planctomycetaceae bacterium]|nr:CRTAC1 family protein [Planctomycetaceae bacterium]